MTSIVPATRTRLTPNHIRGFWAAWGGWALDGMDSFIYSLVLVPAESRLERRFLQPAEPEFLVHGGRAVHDPGVHLPGDGKLLV